MRVALLSDIHGNLTALEAVLRDLRSVSPDLVLHGGDLVCTGARPREVMQVLLAEGWPGVRGNTDEIVYGDPGLEDALRVSGPRQGLRKVLMEEFGPFAAATLGPDAISHLRQLPLTIERESFTLMHASPADTWSAPGDDASDDDFARAYGTCGTPFVFYGHLHRVFIRSTACKIIANTGSVGIAYDGDPHAKYLLFEDGKLTHRRVDYDIEAEVRAVHASGCPRPEWLAQMLRSGTLVMP